MRANRVVAALAAILTFASVANAAEGRPIVIGDDQGGLVENFLMWYGRLRESGTPVILRGVCVSACTFVLTLPKTQVCVEPTASLGFHMAHDEEGKLLPDLTAALIRRWYPLPVRQWLTGKDLGDVPTFMTAREIMKLGIFPACEASE